ncbi:hypothetical protein NHH82_05290 [Oxalobacteraceae bacterium OTU3REALA1]|nr:hypothetical protein NHH82_05290 [Oxalobacteraceae bacterium OTU3REALA1]
MEFEAKQAIYIPVIDYLNLEFFLMDTRPGVKPGPFVVELVKRWLATETARLTLRNGQAARGFQWKNVFLPEGTALRTSHCDVVEFAKVVGDRIVSEDDMSLTPSMFANRHAKGRNAWRFVWLRLPGNDHWVRAANYRRHSEDAAQRRSKTMMATV